jgi:diguanylate cyclase (GGDEF)-like protein
MKNYKKEPTGKRGRFADVMAFTEPYRTKIFEALNPKHLKPLANFTIEKIQQGANFSKEQWEKFQETYAQWDERTRYCFLSALSVPLPIIATYLTDPLLAIANGVVEAAFFYAVWETILQPAEKNKTEQKSLMLELNNEIEEYKKEVSCLRQEIAKLMSQMTDGDTATEELLKKLLSAEKLLETKGAIDDLRKKRLLEASAEGVEDTHLIKKLKNLAKRNPDTKLYKQTHLLDCLNSLWSKESLKKKYSVTLAFIDLDDLKKINKAHTHVIGSSAIAELAGILKKIIESMGTLIHYGGDEFVVLFINKSREEVMKFLKEVMEKVRQAKIYKNQALGIKDSDIGEIVDIKCTIAVDQITPSKDNNPKEFLSKVSALLLRGKETKKDEIYTGEAFADSNLN